jgi:hypothetical protein
MTSDDKKMQKKCKYFSCSACHFETGNKNNFNKHLLTAKHQRMTNDDRKTAKNCHSIFECSCGNIYKYRQGLFNHKKKCNFDLSNSENTVVNPKVVNSVFIMEMFKENQEFKNMLIDQCKQSELQQKKMFELQQENNTLINKMVEITQQQPNTSTIITNNNNTNNTQFNIQLFLNENCKHAVNFSEFIDNIQVSTSDLENNAKMGFVNGISKLILDNLKQLELTERPIHCTDIKRETIYVKEEDEWDKEKSHEVIQKGIQEITCKNMCQLSEWREENPEYNNLESELSDLSIVMQQQSMAGPKREEFYTKIIKNIAKESVIDKKKMLE